MATKATLFLPGNLVFSFTQVQSLILLVTAFNLKIVLVVLLPPRRKMVFLAGSEMTLILSVAFGRSGPLVNVVASMRQTKVSF